MHRAIAIYSTHCELKGTASTRMVVPCLAVTGNLDIFTVASSSPVDWKPIPIEAVVCVHKNSPLREFLLYCRQIAPPSFSGTPVKKTDSANFSFITFCKSSRGWSEVERARPHSLARNVLTRCSPQPVVLTAVL